MDASITRRPPFGSNPQVGERGSDTQRRILDAALDVFGTAGFSEARVELITEKAGCSRPAFYQYFSSKDDVFWALASQLGTEMVTLAERLERVTPDQEGLDHLTEWIGEFMALHEAWKPVFESFQAASRDHAPRARSSSGVSDRTGQALLRAFGVEDDAANASIVTGMVAVLIRCSFYAEQTPSGMSRQPLVDGVAALLHRIFEGPIPGVNMLPAAKARRVPAVAAPLDEDDEPTLRPRGEKTRQRLLDAGASVLPARGYHDTRVDDLVKAAGVSHGTFYRYFENKDDFFKVLAGAAAHRMIADLGHLRLDAEPAALHAWVTEWFQHYERDGGVFSTWQEMQTNRELAAFSRRVSASLYTRLVRVLQERDFGDPNVDAVTLLAVIERMPHSVYTLKFRSEADVIDATVTILRRGFLGVPA